MLNIFKKQKKRLNSDGSKYYLSPTQPIEHGTSNFHIYQIEEQLNNLTPTNYSFSEKNNNRDLKKEGEAMSILEGLLTNFIRESNPREEVIKAREIVGRYQDSKEKAGYFILEGIEKGIIEKPKGNNNFAVKIMNKYALKIIKYAA